MLLRLAICLSMSGEHELSQHILKNIKATPETFEKYWFYRAVNSYATNDKAEAIKSANLVLDNFNSKTERYQQVAFSILSEAENWKSGDLGDIGRDMRSSKDRLDNYRADDKTRKIQQDIVDKLDKLIKDEENKDKKNQEKAILPPDTSPEIPNGVPDFVGKGIVDDKKLKKMAEEWGKLPPQERAKAIQELSKEYPPKFKSMIEKYFESINKESPK